VEICVTSCAKGGTGKTTFSFILAHVLHYITKKKIYIINLSKIPYNIESKLFIHNKYLIYKDGFAVLDFPAFTKYDEAMHAALRRCDSIIVVADEDPHTLESVRLCAEVIRGKVVAVVLNQVIGRPSLKYLVAYRALGRVYVVRFDERLRIYRGEGVDPGEAKSKAVAEMIKAAVDIAKRILAPR
jgi:MinD-like ATPase involved in chromosome partitioning or flagellar assembly